jgi:hypothetical protein
VTLLLKSFDFIMKVTSLVECGVTNTLESYDTMRIVTPQIAGKDSRWRVFRQQGTSPNPFPISHNVRTKKGEVTLNE